jgi:hypothetical protein
VIRPISYSEILGAPNAAELLREYEEECSLPEIGRIDPQAATYAAMERSGAFQCFGLFEDDGSLVGFASVLVYVNPHYNKPIATVESLFVAEAHRSGSAWFQLRGALKEYSRRRGCVALLLSAPVGSKLARLLFVEEDECRNSNHVFITRL